MSAPRKPWEEAGINTRSSVVSFDSPSRLLLGAVPPRLNTLRDSEFGKMASSTSESTKLHLCLPDLKHRDQMRD